MKRSAIILGCCCWGLAALALAQEHPWQQAVAARDYAAAEQLLRQELALRVDDTELRFALARVLAWQGSYQQALRQYEGLLAVQSGNADFLLGKAQVLYWQGELLAAREAVGAAKALAPDYLEVWRLEVQVLLAMDQPAAFDQAEALLAEARQRFGAAAVSDLAERLSALRHPASAFVPRREVEAGGGYEDLSKGYDPWKYLYLEGESRSAPRQALYGRARLTERFRLNDTELLLGTAQPLGEAAGWLLEVSASPTHEVLPEYSVLFGGQLRLAAQWDATLTAKRSGYEHTYSNLYSAGVGYAFGANRLDYVLYLGKAENADEAFAHRVQWTRYYGEMSRVALYAAAGQETENSGVPGPNELLTDSVRTIGLAGRHWFGNGPWGLVYQLWSHEQGDRYTRWGGSLGLRYRF